MNIERELSLINFSYYLKANPDKVQGLAREYYTQFLEQQSKIRDLEQSCKELKAEKKELYTDYKLLRKELEKEQRRNSTAGGSVATKALLSAGDCFKKKNIASNCDLHLRLPNFLSPNPHNYL